MRIPEFAPTLIESLPMRHSLLVLILLLPSTLLPADPRWIKATSSNFELYTTAGDKKAREAILHFEQVRSFFLKTSGLKPPAKVRILAFQSDKEYSPYRINEGAAAHAGGSLDHDEIVMRSISEENYPVAVHEYVHILLKTGGKIPLWLNEGEAELFSTLMPAGKEVRVGALLPGRLAELRDAKWLDLETLCAVERDSPYYNDKDKQRIFYAESWALTHMLVLDERYRAKFSEFLDRIHAGAPPEEAFHTAFGKPLGEIWKDLQAYTRRQRFNVLVYGVTLEKSAEDPCIRPATPFESGLVLAGALADVPRKQDEARQAYQKLAIAFPAAPEIPEGLAYLAWRSHDPDEARAQFAKAVELGSKNARLYYDYAGLDPERRIALLRKAVVLEPEFRDARLKLAYAQMSVEDYKGALVSFAGMKKVEPKEAFEFFRAVAYAQYRLGDKDAARRAAGRAAEYARNPGEKVVIERVIEAISSTR